MTFSWMAAIYQVIMILLIVLFFVGLFLFVNNMIQTNRKTTASLKRLEEKMEMILKEIKEEKRN